jgi:hypothetical protein
MHYHGITTRGALGAVDAFRTSVRHTPAACTSALGACRSRSKSLTNLKHAERELEPVRRAASCSEVKPVLMAHASQQPGCAGRPRRGPSSELVQEPQVGGARSSACGSVRRACLYITDSVEFEVCVMLAVLANCVTLALHRPLEPEQSEWNMRLFWAGSASATHHLQLTNGTSWPDNHTAKLSCCP